MDLKLSSILASILILVSTTLVVKLLNWVWFRPKKLEKLLRKQGLNGNPYRLLLGDMQDFGKAMKTEQPKTLKLSDHLPPHILPYYHDIIDKYGRRSFVWFGPSPRVNVADPELIREILSKPGLFQKPLPDPIGETIVGGLLFLEDEKWAKHRKIINQAFHMEKLKNMIPAMFLSCSKMIEKWEASISSCGSSQEIDVWPSLEDLSGDVISRTAFGSSYEEGRRIFELQKEQVKLVLHLLQFSFIPGWRGKAMESDDGEIMRNDLLGILMESNFREIQEHGNKNVGLSIEDVIEECKLFYFAGKETTANLLVWTMVLLSKHQDWQARAREEVLQVFGKKQPTFDGLHQLKTVTMIFQEVLRLYPPAPLIIRAPTKTLKLGSTIIPVGVQLTLLIGLLHHDPNIWAMMRRNSSQRDFRRNFECNKDSVLLHTVQLRSSVCVGQNFAMIEAKMALANIQHFSFEFLFIACSLSNYDFATPVWCSFGCA
ncbi:UNVERIFIED_CONTAM: cytochrome [Sesamum latifolium]|uniref:Cytochrome n=1 Tax=Sesamum latifolium TaxID=2727402 RepID=A0AAW2TR16_9LAMI